MLSPVEQYHLTGCEPLIEKKLAVKEYWEIWSSYPEVVLKLHEQISKYTELFSRSFFYYKIAGILTKTVLSDQFFTNTFQHLLL